MMDGNDARDALKTRLIERAWRDEEFRSLLLSEPRAALEQELGARLPARMLVKVLEETPDSLCLVLPLRPEAGESRDLSDRELDAVSAGYDRDAFGFDLGSSTGSGRRG